MKKETKDFLGGLAMMIVLFVATGLFDWNGELSIGNLVIMIVSFVAIGILQLIPEKKGW